MPKVEDIFSKLNGATYFTTLDLQAGYHHIPLDEPSIHKTAFNSPSGITTYKVLTSLLEMTINLSHISVMERTLIIKLIDGVWNLPHITSPLSGFQEPGIKQQIASPD